MTLVRRWVSFGALLVTILALPASGFAQTEAVITGVVTDSSGGVLPGVTVTAVHDAAAKRDGDGRSAARQRHADQPRRQHRPEAVLRAAGGRAQLDGAAAR